MRTNWGNQNLVRVFFLLRGELRPDAFSHRRFSWSALRLTAADCRSEMYLYEKKRQTLTHLAEFPSCPFMSNSAGSALQFQPHTGVPDRSATPGQAPSNPIKFAYSRLTVWVEFTAQIAELSARRRACRSGASPRRMDGVRETTGCAELEEQSGVLFGYLHSKFKKRGFAVWDWIANCRYERSLRWERW